MTKYEFEPHQCEETGAWYCRKLVYMSSPKVFGEFDNEADCQTACNYLNSIDKDIGALYRLMNLMLEVREVK